MWDGPEDCDEEVKELLPFKNDFERKEGVKFSKNGIIKFIEDQIAQESTFTNGNAKNAALWEESLS